MLSDSGRDIDRLIDEEMRNAGMSIASDARTLLASLIGGDRRASRSEIGKLALYAHGKGNVDIEDVIAVVADATIPAVDGVVDAAFAGRPGDLEINFAKARSSGVSATAIAGAAVRQAAALHRFRLSVDAGSAITEVVRAPVVHFSREKLVKAALEILERHAARAHHRTTRRHIARGAQEREARLSDRAAGAAVYCGGGTAQAVVGGRYRTQFLAMRFDSEDLAILHEAGTVADVIVEQHGGRIGLVRKPMHP